MVHGDERQQPPRGFGLPITILTIAFLVLVVFQTSQLIRERDALEAMAESQTQSHDQAQKVIAQLDTIAQNTLKLAEAGNANAKALIDQLAAQGVSITPNASE